MKRLLDYDNFTGIETWFHYDEMSDVTTIHETADLEPLHRQRYEMRKDDEMTKKGIKHGHWLYASIHPLEQQLILQKYGVDVFNKDQWKQVMKILNTDPDFQRCKTTVGNHG